VGGGVAKAGGQRRAAQSGRGHAAGPQAQPLTAGSAPYTRQQRPGAQGGPLSCCPAAGAPQRRN
jgi:hypothetical protein